MMTPDEFLGFYHGRKKVQYAQAQASLRERPLVKKDTYIRAFVKAEKIKFVKVVNPFIGVHRKHDPAPRLIQPRDYRFLSEAGRYFKPIEHKLYRKIDQLFYRSGCKVATVFKGRNNGERGAFIATKFGRFRKAVALSIDATRFDQHARRQALAFSHKIFANFFRGAERRKFQRMLKWCLKTHGVAYCPDGRVKYTNVHGNRCSGDFDTALGNVLIVCSIIYDYFMRVLGGRVLFELADDGDDAVIIVDESSLSQLDGLADHFLSYGFQIKRENVARCLEEVVFCHTQPVFDGTDWVMVRGLDAVAKDCVCIGQPNDSHAAWSRAVALCGEACAGGMPVWDSFYRYLLRYSGQLDRRCSLRRLQRARRASAVPGGSAQRDLLMSSGLFFMAVGMSRKFGAVPDAARVSFHAAFGLTPAEQLAVEAYYDGCNYTACATQSAPEWPFTPLDTAYTAMCRGPRLLC